MERFVVSELVDGHPDKPAPLVRMKHDGLTVNIARVPTPDFHYIGFAFFPRVLEAPMPKKIRPDYINTLLPSVWLAQTHFQATIGYVTSDNDGGRWPHSAHESVTIPPNEIMLFEAGKGVALWALEQYVAIRAFHDSLQELLAELRAYNMKGHGDVFLVERVEDLDEFQITASETLPLLSADLCERVRNNGWYEWPFPAATQQSH